MEVDGSHPGRTLGLTTAELKHLLQSKEETPENLLLDLEKHVMVKEYEYCCTESCCSLVSDCAFKDYPYLMRKEIGRASCR